MYYGWRIIAAMLCRNPATDNLCSKCFRERQGVHTGSLEHWKEGRNNICDLEPLVAVVKATDMKPAEVKPLTQQIATM